MLLYKRKIIKLDRLNVSISLSNSDYIKRLNSVGLTETDLKYLKFLSKYVEVEINDIVDEFYTALMREEELVRIINQHSSTDKLKMHLKNSTMEFFKGAIDDRYFESRFKVAIRHVEIGLKSVDYIASFDVLSRRFQNIMSKNLKNVGERMATLRALNKIINLEQQLVLGAFDKVIHDNFEKNIESRKLIGEEIVSSSESLASVAEESNASYQEMFAQVENLLNTVSKTNELADSMSIKASAGHAAIINQTKSMKDIAESTKRIEEDLKHLSDVNIKIEDVLNVIKDIANQTNLLSLNAQIESAKAGEFGKGFAVVANEVRKLAEETKNSIKDVDGLLSSINKESEMLRKAVSEVSSSVAYGESVLNSTNNGINDIIADINENKEQNKIIEIEVNELSSVIEELSKAFNVVAESADSLANASHNLMK